MNRVRDGGLQGRGKEGGIERKAGTVAQSPSGAPRGFVLQVLPSLALKLGLHFREPGEAAGRAAARAGMLSACRSHLLAWDLGARSSANLSGGLVCSWKRNTLCSLAQLGPREGACCSQGPEKPVAKGFLRGPLSPALPAPLCPPSWGQSQGSPGLQPAHPYTSDAASALSAFSGQALHCLSCPQPGAPSPCVLSGPQTFLSLAPALTYSCSIWTVESLSIFRESSLCFISQVCAQVHQLSLESKGN